MEKYIFKLNNIKFIKQGKYFNKIHEKQTSKYGEESALKISNTARTILQKSFNQINDKTVSNNVLLVGKVQSGKTSNLELLTALAFDNGYDCLIIYGGYDNKLLQQSINRFNETFKEFEVIIISTIASNFNDYDENFFKSKKSEGSKIIILSIKRPDGLNKVNKLVKDFAKNDIKTFIIDDEGDQASLNNDKDKVNNSSATYKSICNMKKVLNNPLYYSVTATPQANIFQYEFSELVPDGLHLIKPGSGYHGATTFHQTDSHIIAIEEKDILKFEDGKCPDSLKTSIYYFIIASAIMIKRGKTHSDMIIHMFREVKNHNDLYSILNVLLDDLKSASYDDDEFELHAKGFMKIYNDDKYFKPEIREQYSWEIIKILIRKIIQGVKLIIQNGAQTKNTALEHFKYKIYIGGDLLQRGVTFDNLVTTYFSRWANKGNMDTSLQRARWLGYRENFIDLCKIFTTRKIAHEFSNLTEMDEDLWEQFSLVEEKKLSIKDIIVEAGDSNLSPTRKNIGTFRRISFAQKWNRQKTIVLKKDVIDLNNSLVESFVNNYTFNPSSIGRTDGKNSNYYAEILKNDFIDFINSTKEIFDNHPFDGKILINEIQKDTNPTVCVQMMTSYGDLIEKRERSIDEDKISYLLQGPDTSDILKQKYRGDSNVIVNANTITIQISKIATKFDGILNNDYNQYCFAIHFPKRITAFKK